VTKPLKILIGVVALVVVLGGAYAVWEVVRDSAEDQASLGAIGTTPSTAGSGSARSSADGRWKIQTAGETVFVGYRIHEMLRNVDKEVTGRTTGVTGTMTVAGASVTAAEFTADLSALKTDDPLRDNAIKSRGPETSRFPQATFKLTGPLALPSAPKLGEKVSVTAPGELTVHGVTKPVQIPLEAQWDGDAIRVATAGTGLRLQFADYGFSAPSAAFATPDDFGFLEVQLLFVPA
jgi:polyisoprenoid-binding protein YceI